MAGENFSPLLALHFERKRAMNLLIVFTDQQHKFALGRMNPLYQTPHLDALADDGVLFTNAYSNNPLCGPYRGCLMTGLLTSHNGLKLNNMPLPAGVPTLAGVLRSKDWQTGFVGKWHLGGRGTEPIPDEIRGGFERFKGYQMYNGFDPAAPYHNRVAFYDEENVEHIYQEHRTEVTTRLACEMLDDIAASKKPFCMVVGYQAPHYPEQPLPQYEAQYQNTRFPVSEEAAGVEPYTPTFNPRSPEDRTQCPDYQRYGGNMAEYKRLYAAMVSQVDHGVGELIARLKQHNLYENTLIIYTSDHGDMQGSHGMVNKDVPYEMSAGVPFIVRCPNGRKACRSELLVSGVDIFATAMEMAGTDVQSDGCSFLSYVQGTDNQPFRESIISESLHGEKAWQMIRDRQFKLVVRHQDHKPMMLFDVLNDPEEKKNFINEEFSKPIVQEMMNVLLGVLQ